MALLFISAVHAPSHGRFHSTTSLCTICGGQSCMEQVSLPLLRFSPVSIISNMFVAHSFIYYPRSIIDRVIK